MSKQEMITLSGVVYKVERTGHSTERCGIPYENVTLSDSVFNFHRLVIIFSNKKKTKFEPAQIFHTNLKVYLLM